MGWASASEIYDIIINAAQIGIPDLSDRVRFHKNVIAAFEYSDWDTQEECLGRDTAFDIALLDLHPDWVDEEQ